MSPVPPIAATRRKILFVAEAVTLAHIARPLALAAALDPALYDVTLACDKACDWLLADFPDRVRHIHSISSASFLQSLARGSPVYDVDTLRSYVNEDLALIDEIKPDLIVGDFRLSLSVSARLAKVPYAALSNAYWSPYGRPDYVVPSLPMTKFLPIGVAAALFSSVRPLAFALHTLPLNTVRKEFGLNSLGWDLRRTYTDADFVLYADVPELFPLSGQPESHQYLGPIIWSPPVALPEWWSEIPNDLPLVYVSLGSSGQARLLPTVLKALAILPVRALVATAGASPGGPLPENVYVADYLPGDEAARRAKLVICNGGSPTCHQALVAGVPVVGVAGNLDQFLNMNRVVEVGAGEVLRADRFDSNRCQDVARAILEEPTYSTNAGKVASWFSRYKSKEKFTQFVNSLSARAYWDSNHEF